MLFVSAYVCMHSFCVYVKINKIQINKITQLDAIHVSCANDEETTSRSERRLIPIGLRPHI